MTERLAIEQSDRPRTRSTLAEELRRAGLAAGKTVLVHSSLSALGWVSGGPVAMVLALMDVLTLEGTLVMPTYSGDYSDPADWENPPVPESWWQPIRATMPAFDPRYTPTRGMGAIPEAFRRWPGVHRSDHPQYSFAAWGKYAEQVTGSHELAHSLGEGSPLARVYDLDGWVLLLGVGYESNTSFHLAEYRVPNRPLTVVGAPIFVEGQRRWVTYEDVELDSDPFPEIGEAMEAENRVIVGRAGSAQVRTFSQRMAVDFARDWLARYRSGVAAP